MSSNIRGATQSLRWLSDILSLFQTETIKIPAKYRDQVLETKKLLEADTSGLINTVLDFAINSALVDYTVETNSATLTELLNNWLLNINSEFRGRLPTGITALAKEYFRERWKGSSNLLLRTFWNTKNELDLPTTMFFVDGEDIVIQRKDEYKVTLGDEKYYLRIDNNSANNIPLPSQKNEFIFTQKPYDYWGAIEPVPFLIKRGLFRNLKFLTVMSQKGEYIIGRALEYLFLIKKGTERMTLEGRAEMVYSPDDLKKITTEFASLLADKKNTAGTPTYATGFDTELEHVIPEYQKAVNEAMYAPIEKKILAGLGLVDVVTGISSDRRESILNPKPFISEVKQGIEDFKTLLTDILFEIADRNKSHVKYFSGKSVKMEVHSGPVEHFLDSKIRDHIRSMFDRGTISYETYNTVVGAGYVNHKVEQHRREMEAKEKMEDLFYPHLIDNREGVGQDTTTITNQPKVTPDKKTQPVDNVNPDKKGPETKNFKKASLEEFSFIEPLENDMVEEFGESEELDIGKIVKQKDGWHVISEKTGKNLGGPYKTKKEAVARLKQVEYYKHAGELEESSLEKIIELKKLEVLGKQDKVLDKILEEEKNETAQ